MSLNNIVMVPVGSSPISRLSARLPMQPVRTVDAGDRLGECFLAEGEAVGLGAGVGEGYLTGAFGYGAALADELVHTLLRKGAVAVGVGVASVRLARWLPVDADA